MSKYQVTQANMLHFQSFEYVITYSRLTNERFECLIFKAEFYDIEAGNSKARPFKEGAS